MINSADQSFYNQITVTFENGEFTLDICKIQCGSYVKSPQLSFGVVEVISRTYPYKAEIIDLEDRTDVAIEALEDKIAEMICNKPGVRDNEFRNPFRYSIQ